MRNPATDEANDAITVLTLQGPVFPNSTDTVPAEDGELEAPDPSAFGRFSDQDISPAAAQKFLTDEGGIYDVMQVACKGELYVVLETKNDGKSISAPLNFVPSKTSPEKTCEESAVPYKPAAAAAAAAPSSGAHIMKFNGVFLFAIVLVLMVC